MATASQPGATASTFAGQPIDLWVFKTTNNQAPAADFGNVLAYGIFSSTLSTWIFPTPGATPITVDITTSDVNQYLYGGAVAGSPGSLEVAPVPEPTSLALVGLILGVVFISARGAGNQPREARR